MTREMTYVSGSYVQLMRNRCASICSVASTALRLICEFLLLSLYLFIDYLSYSRMVSKFTKCIKFYISERKDELFDANVPEHKKCEIARECADKMLRFITPAM